MIRDDRAVSSAVGYTMTLGIALILMSGLIVAGSQMVGSQRSHTTEAQLTTVAEGLAGSLQKADRMVQSGADPTNLQLYRDLPSQLTGSEYLIRVESDRVRLRVPTEEMEVSVPINLPSGAIGTGGDWIDGRSVVISGDLEVAHDG